MDAQTFLVLVVIAATIVSAGLWACVLRRHTPMTLPNAIMCGVMANAFLNYATHKGFYVAGIAVLILAFVPRRKV